MARQPETNEAHPPAEATGASSAIAPPTSGPGDAVNIVNGQLEDVFFTYDRSELTADGLRALRRDAGLLAPILSEFPHAKLVVEGHCDERGSAEYNLGLGSNRAARVADVLRELGVSGGRVKIISYGKDAPQCMEAAETCWRRNRRVHLVLR